MDKQQQQELEEIIHQRIDYLLTLVSENSAQASDEQSDDEADNMFKVISSSVEEQVIEQSQIEITQLTHALKRLKNGTAGYCEECGCEIPFARLKSVPVTGFCVSCLEQQQKG